MVQFNTFKAEIETQIYKYLHSLAGFVWEKVEDYGFGSVEKIINWFSVEGRRDKLAQIILSDDTLKSDLGYGVQSGELRYDLIAKVGVLVFADYIHKTYIGRLQMVMTPGRQRPGTG